MPLHETGIGQPCWILRWTNRFTMQVDQELTRVITAMDFARHKYLWRNISKRKCKCPKIEKLVMQRIQRNTVPFHRRSASTVPLNVRSLQSDFYMSNAEVPTGYCAAILVSSNYSRAKISLAHEALFGRELLRHVIEFKTDSCANVGVQSLREMC